MTNTTSWNDFSQQPSKLFEPWLFVWLGVAIIVHKIAYSLWFHPLRHIPGPWSTKICGWYEFYTNIWLDGQWCKTYPDLHKRYDSPVVRVGPDHVHIKDINAYEIIFRNGTNFEKDHVFYTCADNDGSIFSLSNRDEHRARRKALSPRFSKKAAEADAPAILNQIKLLEAFMIRHSSLGKSCNVSDLFRAFGINIVAKTLLGDCDDLVRYEENKPELLETVDGLSVMLPILRFFPYMGTISSMMPSFLADQLTPVGVFNFKKACEDYSKSMMEKPIRSNVESSRLSVIEILMAHSLENTGKLPDLNYLTAEAFTFIDAGVDTAGRTLAAAVYFVLRDQTVQRKLQEELDSLSVWDSGNTEQIVRSVGKLPFLNAVIKEAHRIWPSLPGPLPRVVPPEGLQVGSYFIPKGTIISATHHSMHFDEDVFPEPSEFKPERWLRDNRTDLDRYLTPYSRGSRACIGINLAQMELQLCLAILFYHLDMELCEPAPVTLDWKDHFVAEPTSQVLVRAKPRDRGL